MANRNNGNNGVILHPPPPPQPNVQQLNAIFQAPQDPALTWLSEFPAPRRNVAEAVIWPEIDNCD